jgi:eukaryotic-like serine/threonine-protein kinase
VDQTKAASKAASAVRSTARSAVRSVAISSLMLRKQLWIWPILAALVLGICAWWVSRSVEDSMRQRRMAELQTILDADVTALHIWSNEQIKDAELIAKDEQLAPAVQTLLEAEKSSDNSTRALLQSPAQEALRKRLKSQLELGEYSGFLVLSPEAVVIAADIDAPVGRTLPGYQKEFFTKVAAGKSGVSRPFRSVLLLPDEHGELKANLPTMFTAAPLRDAQGQVIAVLGLRIRPDIDFTRIMQVARNGETGETYAFNSDGLLLSESRFDESLKQIGLLADLPDSHSILTLELRDPGVDMTAGGRPAERRANQPLTRMTNAAASGESGVDVSGFRDYRGVPVIGAWTWLKDEGFGVATKQDVAEAFRPLYVLRRAFWGMFALLFASSVAIFVFTIAVARANREARRAALKAQHLGQYTLDEKLGEGGMGLVYRAHHDMLQRPTAVKFLGIEKTNEQTIARFEREVQLTSRLNHPNTIAIYDYGRTPEGVFYYAMEYLEGINLEDLVAKHGPQPEARVIYILLQVCGSLAEAHSIGLIHRDIKPANIFLTMRGGMYDFVKLLDFGLVKALDSRKDASLTTAGSLTGTPLYMPPEAIQHEAMDPRSDLYALGAVGYFLLTGTPVFDGESVISVLQKHVMEPPQTPSNRLGRPISASLEAVLLKCLAKLPQDRPASANELAEELSRCTTAQPWTRKNADDWWQKNYPRAGTGTAKPETEKINFAATQVLAQTAENSDVATSR